MSNITVSVSSDEFEKKTLSDETRRAAVQTFQINGVLKMANILSKEKVDSLYNAYLKQLDFTDDQKGVRNALRVGESRYMSAIDVEGVFNDVEVYANSFLYPVMQVLLGDTCVLNSFGAVIAFPGSDQQHFHFDHPSLFPEEEGISSMIPAYAVTVAIPLVDVDKVNGPTLVWSGSHRINESDQVSNRFLQALEGERGCCYMWDYRVLHGGLSNQSDQLRPLLYFVYARPWFNDAVNFDCVKPLNITDEELEKVPEKFRGIFQNR